LTWEKGAPDGFERYMILTNGQFPGPTLTIEEGDTVYVSLTESVPKAAILMSLVHRGQWSPLRNYNTFSWD
jgi:FtsP/CotA-like multicopper oxidase with cupredoxin domain